MVINSQTYSNQGHPWSNLVKFGSNLGWIRRKLEKVDSQCMIMQKELPLLQMRGHKPKILILHHQMTIDKWKILVGIRLYHIAFMLVVRGNKGFLIALIECLHLKNGSFHLPMRETIVTLEDVWCILQISIQGELEEYDPTIEQVIPHQMFACGNVALGIRDYEI